MKLSSKTLEILNNFASVNENLVIPVSESDEETHIRTRNNSSNVWAEATVPEVFPVEVTIYDLTKLLAIFRLFDDADIDFKENHLVIKDSASKNRVRYYYAKKNVLTYPDKQVKMPEPDVTVNLGSKDLAKAKKAATTLGVPNISVIREDGRLFLRAQDISDQSSNHFDIDLGEGSGEGNDDFQVHFSMDTLNIIPLEYQLAISLKGIAEFKNSDYDVTYYIAMRV